MKNIRKGLFVALCSLSLHAHAQSSVVLDIDAAFANRGQGSNTNRTIDTSGTTIEEYNYLTKGYQIQIESGLDMKKGYTLKFFANHFSGQRDMKFYALRREGREYPCAILIIYQNAQSGFLDYICVPHYRSRDTLWAAYFAKIQTYSGEGAIALTWGVTKAMAYFAQNN